MAGMRSGANFLLKEVPAGIEFEAQTIIPEDAHAITRGIFYRPAGKRPKVGVHIMHPRNDQSLNYNGLPLVQAGYAVLGRGGRWPNNDMGTTHEHLLLDVAAGVRRLRELGCEQVVLLGNSGGGGLATYYQAQARLAPPARHTHTPADDPLDLNRFDMPPANGIALVGAHPGEGFSLARWMDPSVVDETEPLLCNPELDMYSFDNGFRVPPEPSRYTADFLARFSAAKAVRAQRLDELARQRVARRRHAAQRAREIGGRDRVLAQHFEREAQAPDHLRIIRALAYPAWLDPSIEPEDERDICCYNNDPRPDLANYRVFHSAFLTPEAYLSTWSGISGRARTIDRLREIHEPVLVVHYAGDSVCHISDGRAMYAAAGGAVKHFELIRGADHYGYKILGPHQRGERVTDATDALVAWMQQHFPL